MASIDQLVSTIPGLKQLVAGQAQTIVDGRFTAGIVGPRGPGLGGIRAVQPGPAAPSA